MKISIPNGRKINSLLLQQELAAAGISAIVVPPRTETKLDRAGREFSSYLEAAIEILNGDAEKARSVLDSHKPARDDNEVREEERRNSPSGRMTALEARIAALEAKS